MNHRASRVWVWAAGIAGAPAILAAVLPLAGARDRAGGAGTTGATAPPSRVAAAEGPSEAVFPPQRIPLRFDHARHVGTVGLSCTYCHSAAATSQVATDRLLPAPERCDACHGTDHSRLEAVASGVGPAAECAFCHQGHTSGDGPHVARVVIPPPNLRFDHEAHHARGIECGACHVGVEATALATTSHLPRMPTCLGCHDEDGPGEGAALPAHGVEPDLHASGACDTCHLTEAGSRLVTTFPSGQLLPPAWMGNAEHGPDWIRRHARVAGANSTACASCHEESECVDCHDGRVRPRSIHPGDWLTSHALATRADDPTCGSCHRAQSFCVSCHQRSGVARSGPLGTIAGRGRFHPPQAVWTARPRTARHHSWEAERNIQVCVSCHTERDCSSCHATAARGGLGDLSPHPAGFGASCARALAKNPRPCLYCHENGDRSLASCR